MFENLDINVGKDAVTKCPVNFDSIVEISYAVSKSHARICIEIKYNSTTLPQIWIVPATVLCTCPAPV